MELYLNFIFAWISTLLVLLLSVIYVLRKVNKKAQWIKSLNRFLRCSHIHLGVLLVITGFLHGIFSSEALLTLNLGTVCWMLSILLGLNYMFRGIFRKKRLWIVYHRIITIIFIVVIALHIINVGGIQIFVLFKKQPNEELKISATHTHELTPTSTSTSTSDPSPTVTETPEDSSIYNDGTYRGTATGFRDGLVVEVTIKDDTITSVVVIEHNEVNKRFWGRPVEYIPQYIVENQSTDVDIISGATYTSIGIMNATEDALAKAMK